MDLLMLSQRGDVRSNKVAGLAMELVFTSMLSLMGIQVSDLTECVTADVTQERLSRIINIHTRLIQSYTNLFSSVDSLVRF